MTVINKHSRLPRKYSPEEPEKEDKPALNVESFLKLREANPLVILQRYLSDESTEAIAASYGVTRQGLGQFLLRHAEEDWKEAQVARAIARKEKAEDDLEAAKDPLALAKARELLKAAQWDLERTCRRIYGEDKAQQVIQNPELYITVLQEGKQPAHVSVSIAHAEQSPGRVIEGETAQESVSITQQTPINGT
jgi:hypothetical protein